jgi:hypothetical protein
VGFPPNCTAYLLAVMVPQAKRSPALPAGCVV